MMDTKTLENKIRELEKRIEILETNLGDDPLYTDAKRLVKKHHKASIIFLQKHLFIDFDRAAKIMDKLKREMV